MVKFSRGVLIAAALLSTGAAAEDVPNGVFVEEEIQGAWICETAGAWGATREIYRFGADGRYSYVEEVVMRQGEETARLEIAENGVYTLEYSEDRERPDIDMQTAIAMTAESREIVAINVSDGYAQDADALAQAYGATPDAVRVKIVWFVSPTEILFFHWDGGEERCRSE